MARSALGKLQNDFLREFFSRKSSFYLTGGAALVGFYFGHRETQDLDLFTLTDDIEIGFKLVRDTADALGARLESLQTAPDFRRCLVSQDDDSVVIDLVREYVFQMDETKRVFNGIRVDTAEEIFANKLCAILSRSEIRDVVDVRQLENAGLPLTDALEAAKKKDSGLSAAQLAWILNQIKLNDNLKLPGAVPVSDLRTYIDDLVLRLQKLALPS